MTDYRALIDRIADALGPDATPERVESVARAVLDGRRGAPAPEATAPEPITGRVLVTAYGCDTPGVLAGITATLSDAGANVLDVSQKILQGYFTLIMLADLEPAGIGPGELQRALAPIGERLGVRVMVQHEDLFYAMHRP